MNKTLETEIKELKQHLQDIQEYGTEEINAAVDLRIKLARCHVEMDKWKKVSDKLYSVVLHLQEISKNSPVVAIGSGLYSEAIEAISNYNQLKYDK